MVRAFLGVLCLGIALSAGCSGNEAHVCTDVGCTDGATFTLRPPLSHWDNGAYQVEVTFDGVEHACPFSVPDDLPSGGTWRVLACTPGLSVFIAPEVNCEEHRDGDTASETCTPVPEKYFVQGSMNGTPATYQVVMLRDGAKVVDHTETPSYKTAQPNGPECGPICHQASVDLTFP